MAPPPGFVPGRSLSYSARIEAIVDRRHARLSRRRGRVRRTAHERRSSASPLAHGVAGEGTGDSADGSRGGRSGRRRRDPRSLRAPGRTTQQCAKVVARAWTNPDYKARFAGRCHGKRSRNSAFSACRANTWSPSRTPRPRTMSSSVRCALVTPGPCSDCRPRGTSRTRTGAVS